MEILSTEVQHATPHLSMFKRTCEHKGKKFDWFFASRDKEPPPLEKKTPDAVVVVSIHIDDKGTPKLVLTSEFRVPIGGREINFPAGIIDPGQSYSETAIRELKEETGLDLEVQWISPNLYSSAGLTNESSVYVFGRASGTPSNEHLEGHEDIEVYLADMEQVRLIANGVCGAIGNKAWPLLWMYSIYGGFVRLQ